MYNTMLELEDLKKQPMIRFLVFFWGGGEESFSSASFNSTSLSIKQISRLLFNKLIMYFIKEPWQSDSSLKNYITLNEIWSLDIN